MFFIQLIIGAFLISITVVIHAFALDYTIKRLEKWGPLFFRLFHRAWKTILLIITVLSVFLAHIVQMWIWALFYWGVAAVPSFEEALYFSTSTFTTVGFGDIVLDKQWRLLSSFQAANGFILFGWSTAFIFEIMSQLHKDDKIEKRGKF